MTELVALFLQSSVAEEAAESQDAFWDVIIWLIVAIPLVIAAILAWANRPPYREVREFGPGDFAADVLDADRPTLVHFYRNWSIGDQVMIAQVEKIAARARDFAVGFVDVGKHPQMLELFSRIEPPALLLFAGGERIFQCEGVFDEADVVAEVQECLTRWRIRESAASESGGEA